MKASKRRKIGVLAKRDPRIDRTSESEPETRATVVEEGDVIKVTFGGDTEDELEDEVDEDEVDEDEDDEDEVGRQNFAQLDASPLTTRVLIR